MSFLGTRELLSQLPSVISPYDPEQISSNAYELTLHEQAYITEGSKNTKLSMGADGQCCIQPGQFALLLSAERVTMPSNIMGFISIKARIKFQGLVNVSGFHVDPGFDGRLKFAVYNAGSGPITLDSAQRCFQLWLHQLTSPLDEHYLYKGKQKGQMSVTGEDINRLGVAPVSPMELERRHQELSKRLERWINIGKAVIAFGFLIIGAWLTGYLDLRKELSRDKMQAAMESFLTTPAATMLLDEAVRSSAAKAATETSTDSIPSEGSGGD